ncbi:chemotaxis protein CheW [Clostridium sp. C105KSO13]|uniref:chemotaxis protein CheW n=1 Tax=Clostridium sp. C105KSO13 TaxID=1776045 RepID=UPI00074062C1|nr:Chemotaxis protein CheV [Clostridium sp. C105KSO13]
MAKTEILLESGTNEIEIMEFTVYNELYGIDVVKVREIMMSDKVKPIPHAHEAVEGIFKPRDIMLTVVDLPYYLTGDETAPGVKDLFMVTNFNKMNIAFRVHTVEGIQRISRTDIKKPDKTLSRGCENGIAAGIAQCGKELITILDFEKIAADIAPEKGLQTDEEKGFGGSDTERKRINGQMCS